MTYNLTKKYFFFNFKKKWSLRMLPEKGENLVSNRLPPILWEEFKKMEKISDGVECLRPLIKLMAQIYLNDLKNKPGELTDGQIE
jgi:hypothetical protein